MLGSVHRWLNTYKPQIKEGCKCWHLTGAIYAGESLIQNHDLSLSTMAKISVISTSLSETLVPYLFDLPIMISLFGKSLNFETTPYHPRHVFSLATWSFSLFIVTAYAFQNSHKEQPWVGICELVHMTHRTTLHELNALVRLI